MILRWVTAPPLASTNRWGSIPNTSFHVPAAAHLVVLQQVGVDEHAQLLRVTEGRHARGRIRKCADFALDSWRVHPKFRDEWTSDKHLSNRGSSAPMARPHYVAEKSVPS